MDEHSSHTNASEQRHSNSRHKPQQKLYDARASKGGAQQPRHSRRSNTHDEGPIQFTIISKPTANPPNHAEAELLNQPVSLSAKQQHSTDLNRPVKAPTQAKESELASLQSILTLMQTNQSRITGNVADSSMRFNTEELAKVLQDTTEIVSLGVAGLQGVGKSTIASALCGGDDCFPKSLSRALAGKTKGIDACLSPEKLLILDTQDCNSYDQMIDLQTLRQTLLLHCICEVMVVVFDNVQDSTVLKTVCAAALLRQRLIKDLLSHGSELSPSLENGLKRMLNQPTKYVFVYNKAPKNTDPKQLSAKVEKWVQTNLPSITGVTNFRPVVCVLPACSTHTQSSVHTRDMVNRVLNTIDVQSHFLEQKDWIRFVQRARDVVYSSSIISEFSREIQRYHPSKFLGNP